MTKGLTKPSQIAGPPSMVTCDATASSAARASMVARSAASTPPVSANTVWTFQPCSCRYGTQKEVSRPPEKARTMSLFAMGDRFRIEGGSATLADERCHHGLLHVQAVFGFVDGDAT